MVIVNTFRPKLRKFLAQLPYVPETFGLLLAAAPWHATLWLTLLVIQGALPVAIVYAGREVLNALTSGANRHAILVGALFAGMLLLAEVLRTLASWVRTAQSELLTDRIYQLIHSKAAGVDLAFYDSAEFYDHLHRARQEAIYRPLGLLDSVGGILQNGLTLVCMLAVLLRFGLWVPAALAVSTIPAVYVVLRSNMLQHRWRLRNTATERRSWYYDWLLTEGETAAELRLFGLADYFQSRFRDLRTQLRTERLRLARRELSWDLGATSLALVVTGAAMLMMLRRALSGVITIGDLVLFFGAFQGGLRLGRVLLDNVGQLYLNSLFLENLFEFLHLQPRVVSPPIPAAVPQGLTQGIDCRNIRFSYPQAGRRLLDHFDLFIPAGKLTAIVGSNGCGKSTLLKLLCRFYDPDSGSILMDGVDLRQFPVDDLRRCFTVVFQDPVRYNTTVEENISLGDLANTPAHAAIVQAAHSSGAAATIAQLPDGYDTLLGKRFEKGTDLSVGEWQRLALARAFLRPSPILILDEPTSAMDPWAEAEWLENFRRLAEGRTAIVITHRFTTAMYADLICVMRDGRIVERGSHGDLLAQDGLYAAGWSAQLQKNKADPGA